MDRPPRKPGAPDLQDAIRELTGYLQQRPLATAALLALATAIGAGASSIGRRPARPRLPRGAGEATAPALTEPPASRRAIRAAQAMAPAAPPATRPTRVPRRPPKRKGMGVAAFEFRQKAPGGRKTDVDFSWTGPKPKPGAPPPPPDLRESRIGVALFEFEHSRPGGKDTAIKFGWSKEPLEPLPPAAPAAPPATEPATAAPPEVPTGSRK